MQRLFTDVRSSVLFVLIDVEKDTQYVIACIRMCLGAPEDESSTATHFSFREIRHGSMNTNRASCFAVDM
eukprot:scaffold28633_cov67-Skeletonema_dohrnii-CCMP3373.AAC.1